MRYVSNTDYISAAFNTDFSDSGNLIHPRMIAGGPMINMLVIDSIRHIDRL